MATSNAGVAVPLAALFCLGLMLFAIAATVVLALIPIYIPTKSATLSGVNSVSQLANFSIPISSTTPVGSLNANALAQITNLLRASQTKKTLSDGSLNVVSGNVIGITQRKRQTTEQKILNLAVLVLGRNINTLTAIETLLATFINQDVNLLAVLIAQIINSFSTTTTLSPIIVSTTATTSGIVSTTATTSGIVSTTATTSGIVSTKTSGAVSTTLSGKRRRQPYEDPFSSSSSPPLVTYKD